MDFPPSTVKILKTEFAKLLSDDLLKKMLLDCDLYSFEKNLHQKIYGLYDKLCESYIQMVSTDSEFVARQKSRAGEKGLKKLVFRETHVRVRTGTKIKYTSLYSKSVSADYSDSRYLCAVLWRTNLNCSPMYQSVCCLQSVLCPSYEVSKKLLSYQDVHVNQEKIQQISLGLATECIAERPTIQLSEGDGLSGKRVVIAMDGGRSRTRVYQDEKAGRAEKFDTPWREPKMFVISTIDDQGKLNKMDLPIYDSTFGDDEIFSLLGDYLRILKIGEAESVQFLGDGAPWIWNRVRPLLLSLGVAADKIIETLDYYHAAEHLNEMKVYLDKDKQDSHFKLLKNALWQGDFKEITRLVKEGIRGVDLENFNPFKYFKKQQKRIGYQLLRDDNRPCGSGIIESGIRRIINLRFKSPSTFWYPENLEKLIFMRGVALAGRWDIMMNNRFSKL